MASRRGSPETTVYVCGDAAVGRALVLLLRGAGYDAKFFPVPSPGKEIPPNSLRGAHICLITPTPGLSTKRREAFLASIRNASEAAGAPILELISTSERMSSMDAAGLVLWPCSIEELERRIREVLNGVRSSVLGTSSGSPRSEERASGT